MATLKTYGNEVYKVVSSGTSGLSVDTIVNSSGVSVNSPFADLKMTRQSDRVVPTALTISGDWSNAQYVSTAVDTTGLTFTASYSDGSSKSVTPTSYSPVTWSSTAGSQTCTFTYTEDGISQICSKSASVQSLPVWDGLKFTANTAGSIIDLRQSGSPSWIGYYSTNNGSTWNTYTVGTTGAITLANAGDSICFKGTLSAALSNTNYLQFLMTGSIAASGNIMSFCSGDNFASVTTIPYNLCFYYLFHGCISLTTAPELPATTLKAGCYESMFENCTSLTAAPALPATTLKSGMIKDGCYQDMFYGCTSLTTAPVLPATTLTYMCYEYMFYGCTSLKINNTGSSGTLFFTCPSTIPSGAVSFMFKSTGGSYTSDPVANGTYYYY